MSKARCGRPAAASVPVSRLHAYGLLLAVIVLWGASWPIMKVGLLSIPPLWFGLVRIAMGAVTLFVVLAISGRLVLPRRADLPIIASVGLLQMVGFLTFVNIGLLSVEAGRSAILAYTTPLWVVPAAVLFLKERICARKAMGLAVGLMGVAMLFNPLGFDWGDGDQLRGNGLLMLAALCWAGAILHVRTHEWVSSPLQLAPWQMIFASSIVLVLAWYYEGGLIAATQWSPELAVILIYSGIIATGFCLWASVTVTRSLPAMSTSLGFLGVPVTGMLSSALFLGEPLTLTLLGGLVLILAGMALVNLADIAPARERH